MESAVADSTWITARVPKNGLPQLTKLGPGASVTDTTMPAPEESGVSQMSFATPSQGWVVTNGSKLLSTNDGGATWTDITAALVRTHDQRDVSGGAEPSPASLRSAASPVN